MRTPRWVLDTNVVLSALIRPGGLAGRLRLAWQAARFIPLASHDTVAELIRVLAYPKFRLTPEQQHDLLADYLPWVEPVVLPERLPKTPTCRDLHDQPFLTLAVVAQADAIVSGDHDLLAMHLQKPLRVIRLAEAIEALSS